MTNPNDQDFAQKLDEILKRQEELQHSLNEMAADLQAFRQEVQRTSATVYRMALRGDPPQNDDA